MGVFVGGGGGGVDLDLDFKNFWDGVYNFFFCPPLVAHTKLRYRLIIQPTVRPQTPVNNSTNYLLLLLGFKPHPWSRSARILSSFKVKPTMTEGTGIYIANPHI